MNLPYSENHNYCKASASWNASIWSSGPTLLITNTMRHRCPAGIKVSHLSHSSLASSCHHFLLLGAGTSPWSAVSITGNLTTDAWFSFRYQINAHSQAYFLTTVLLCCSVLLSCLSSVIIKFQVQESCVINRPMKWYSPVFQQEMSN